MSKYPRGSEWRKWDLHIHSNASDGSSTPNDIIEEAKKKGLSVIALTDHHTISNIDETKRLGNENGITVISGIEFRTEYGQKSVHMIGLFPDQHNGIQLDQQALNDLILAPLNLSYTRIVAEGHKSDPSLLDDQAFKKGMFLVQVDFKQAADLVHEYGGIVTVHAGQKSNSIEQMKHTGSGSRNVDLLEDSLGTVKEELLKRYIDICEIQRYSESSFYLKTFNKPSIAASDAHKKEEIGSKFTWIKADPTFNGLLQIKYEPDQRVRIQEEKPIDKADYSTIDYIEINNSDFSSGKPTTIPLNSDLTCIIGGKSTGKSLLLNNIAYAIDKEQVIEKYTTTQPEHKKKKDTSLFNPIDGFSFHWTDGYISPATNVPHKNIIYIPQTYLNHLSDEREESTEIDTIIEGILLQDEHIKARYEKLKKSLDGQKIQIDRLLYEYLQLCTTISSLEQKLAENNKSAFIKKEIEKLETEQKQYLVDDALTEHYTQTYNTLLEQRDQKLEENNSISRDIEIIKNISHVQIQLPIEIVELQNTVKEQILSIFDLLQVQLNEDWMSKKFSLLSTLKNQLEENRKQIVEFEKEIKKLQPRIEINSALISLTNRLSKEKAKLNEALKTEDIINKKQEEASHKLNTLVEMFFSYKKISDEFTSFVNERKSDRIEDLNFSVETIFRTDALRFKLYDSLDNRTVSRIKDFNIDQLSESNFTPSILKELVLSVQSSDNDTITLKARYKIADFLNELFSNWYNLNYIVKMDDDDFEKMSPGKKALVLLKLLIGMANNDCPMLIDQPEDDLDNRSIYDDLVKYIKDRKIKRQMIIVTHNANIVIGADADEIIVANRNGQNSPNKFTKFEYVSGSIEDSWRNDREHATLYTQGIKEHICEIMEGGEQAFEKRKNKYYINN